MTQTPHKHTRTSVMPWNNPTVRAVTFQVLLVLGVLGCLYIAGSNLIQNLQSQKITTGFGFLESKAGFGITQSLITYNEDSTYARAAFVGLLNTCLVGGVGVVLATIIGFIIGIARLSKNLLLATLSSGYVELIRNTPLLLQLIFWYMAVLQPLPGPRQSLDLGAGVLLNNRGLFMPRPEFLAGSQWIGIALGLTIFASIILAQWARARELKTGQSFPVWRISFTLMCGLLMLAYFATSMPIVFETPKLQGFNIRGGVTIIPEFVALVLGLVLYTAAFIAEVVRSGIVSVSKGQTEAAAALGLQRGQILRYVVVPQAMRVIIPPLTNQYLNLIKNSTLAVAIGYPDFFQVFTGTVLNQTGQALEIVAVTMVVYLLVSLGTSSLMNWYNARIALVER